MATAEKITVCLNRCLSYESPLLQERMQEQLDLLSIPADLSRRNVLLKPNLISARAPSLACSEPLFVYAAAASFLARGAKVFVGDSPAVGSTLQVLKQQGFTAALRTLDVQYVPFKTKVKKELNCGVKVVVAAEALDCDLFVNLPRIKAHEQMGVTMAVKNVFGIVLGFRKAWLHMSCGRSHTQFAEMILDLQQLLPPSIALADGIEVMNRRGPIAGTSLALGCMAASHNFISLDRALLVLLGVDKEDVPLAMAAQAMGRRGAYLEELTFAQMRPEDFNSSDFRIPAVLSPVKFSPLHYLKSSVKKVLLYLRRRRQ